MFIKVQVFEKGSKTFTKYPGCFDSLLYEMGICLNPKMMPNIFFKMFKSSPKTVIKFLSNKSNILEDLSIILKMPKWTFFKALFY